MSGHAFWDGPPPIEFERIIGRNGASYIKAPKGYGKGPWVPHDDPDLLEWMGQNGYSLVEEIPAVEDLRPPDTCERCGARGVEVHHTAPREWFGDTLCEQWPTQNLCRECHALWHQVSNIAAARTTVRNLRSKGLHRTADKVEASIAGDREKARRAVLSMLEQQRDPSQTESA